METNNKRTLKSYWHATKDVLLRNKGVLASHAKDMKSCWKLFASEPHEHIEASVSLDLKGKKVLVWRARLLLYGN